MLFCQTKDTTFYCRWATSSLPSCCWSLSSSSSSSSHIDTSPKVWRNFCIKIFNWHTNIEYVHIVRTFVLSVFYPQPSTRWATAHKHTHTHEFPSNTLSGVCFYCCVRSGSSHCSSEHFEMDSAGVAVCSLEARNIGEEQVHLRGQARFVRTAALNLPSGVCFQITRTTCWKKKLTSALHQRS